MKTYTRQEAAQILGVDPQTISNYATRGFFDTIKTPTMVLVDKGSFDKFISENYERIKAFADAKVELDKEVKEYRQKAEEAKSYYQQKVEEYKVKNKIKKMAFLPIVKEVCVEYISSVMPKVATENNTHLLLKMLEYGNREEVAQELNISKERVRQLIERGLFRMRHSGGLIARLESENAGLEMRCAKQHAYIEELQREIEKLKKNQSLPVVSNDKLSAIAKTKGLLLCDQFLSVRALNVLRGQCESVYDLLACEISDLKKYRNMGKKTLNEIRDFAEDFANKNPEFEYYFGCFKN